LNPRLGFDPYTIGLQKAGIPTNFDVPRRNVCFADDSGRLFRGRVDAPSHARIAFGSTHGADQRVARALGRDRRRGVDRSACKDRGLPKTHRLDAPIGIVGGERPNRDFGITESGESFGRSVFLRDSDKIYRSYFTSRRRMSTASTLVKKASRQ
jgi:hypothetical protein